jgi:hypothetical protein
MRSQGRGAGHRGAFALVGIMAISAPASAAPARQPDFVLGEGRALDLESLPLMFGEIGACEGVTPVLPDESLPPLTLVESTEDGSGKSHRIETFYPEAKPGQSTLPAGVQDASATEQPWAVASTESPWQSMGLFTLYNPRTEVTTQVVDGVREAHAVMQADGLSILGGMLTLQHIKWEAIARTGSDEVLEGSLEIGYGTLFGLFRTSAQSASDLNSFGETYRNVLGLIGAAIDLPRSSWAL